MNTYLVTVDDNRAQIGTYTVEAPRVGLAVTYGTHSFLNDPEVRFVSGCTLTHTVVPVSDPTEEVPTHWQVPTAEGHTFEQPTEDVPEVCSCGGVFGSEGDFNVQAIKLAHLAHFAAEQAR